ncbi:hypothetical protein HPB50_006184 [Hyalomma asiaticum]|uniref:Uncharacterized protein n=1 Tax=Hyalomma asiaticum TaxID=266040 RepID=A0ACB7SS22_HYAAI|nr:hypothetical protein HPB50_006184 [Hyalomma asiaticum]
MLRELLEGQKTMHKKLEKLPKKLKNVEDSVEIVKELDARIVHLEQTVTQLDKKLTELEDRSRRNNLLVFGVSEPSGETPQSLAQKVIDDILRDTLRVKVSSAERLQKIGRPSTNKPRPVILKLFDHRENVSILSNCYKLKGKNISVSEDFSTATREVRKRLWDSTTDIWRNGTKVKLVYDKIKFGSELYDWDETKIYEYRVINDAVTGQQRAVSFAQA